MRFGGGVIRVYAASGSRVGDHVPTDGFCQISCPSLNSREFLSFPFRRPKGHRARWLFGACGDSVASPPQLPSCRIRSPLIAASNSLVASERILCVHPELDARHPPRREPCASCIAFHGSKASDSTRKRRHRSRISFSMTLSRFRDPRRFTQQRSHLRVTPTHISRPIAPINRAVSAAGGRRDGADTSDGSAVAGAPDCGGRRSIVLMLHRLPPDAHALVGGHTVTAIAESRPRLETQAILAACAD